MNETKLLRCPKCNTEFDSAKSCPICGVTARDMENSRVLENIIDVWKNPMGDKRIWQR